MEDLTYVYSKTLFLWVLEASVQKGMFWFFNFGKPAFFELLAFTGYKFVVLCPVVIADIMAGFYASFAVLFIFGALFALFFF